MLYDRGMNTLQGEDVDAFIKNYRDSLVEQRDASNKQLEQERANTGASIMGSANQMGMLYSNFPAKTKIKYDTQAYYPALAKVQTSYQSGLDKLRANAVDVYNQIKQYEEAIADLNAS